VVPEVIEMYLTLEVQVVVEVDMLLFQMQQVPVILLQQVQYKVLQEVLHIQVELQVAVVELEV
tara:strand:- start:244 stop:432 length:189 start_codon:yes stop_codon:yes gene_type:complete